MVLQRQQLALMFGDGKIRRSATAEQAEVTQAVVQRAKINVDGWDYYVNNTDEARRFRNFFSQRVGVLRQMTFALLQEGRADLANIVSPQATQRVNGVEISGPAPLVQILASLGDEAFQGITHDAIDVAWDAKTYSLFNKVRVGTNLDPADWQEALALEIHNVREQRKTIAPLFEAMSKVAFDLDSDDELQPGAKMESTSEPTEDPDYRAMRALKTEISELRGALDGYLKGYTLYANFFKNKKTFKVVDWLLIQVQSGHTANYDKSAVGKDWRGWRLLESHDREINVSENGLGQLSTLYELIG